MPTEIIITIGKFGGRTKKIKVPANTTVKEVLKKAGFDLSSTEKIWKGGEKATLNQKLSCNTILNVVGTFAGGL